MLDTRRSIATPEGVALSLHVAGPPVRVLAWLIDVMIRLAAAFVFSIVLTIIFGEAARGPLYIAYFLMEFLYPVAFELRMEGATPGKRFFGLQVLHDDGTPAGVAASMLRNFLRFADFLPMLYGFGFGSMLLNRDFKRLGDLAAGTVVVYRHKEPPVRTFAKEEPKAPPIRLELDEQRMLVNFAERLDGWTDARALELATIARPLSGATGSESRKRLLAMANWLVGRR